MTFDNLILSFLKLLYATDEQLIKVYNKESKSIVHEYKMDGRFPRYFIFTVFIMLSGVEFEKYILTNF